MTCYIAHKAVDVLKDCCVNKLKTTDVALASEYILKLSRGGLLHPSENLYCAVSQAFALLDACSATIRGSGIASRRAGTIILKEHLDTSGIVCEEHEEIFNYKLIRTVYNCFFNGQRKRTNESVTKDRIASFKKYKRNKD